MTDLIFKAISYSQALEIEWLLDQAGFSFVRTEYGLALDEASTSDEILMSIGLTLFELVTCA